MANYKSVSESMIADLDWINRALQSMKSDTSKELMLRVNQGSIEFAKGMVFEKRQLLNFIKPLIDEIARGEWHLSKSWTKRAIEIKKLAEMDRPTLTDRQGS